MEAHEKRLYRKRKALFGHGYQEEDIRLLPLALDYGGVSQKGSIGQKNPLTDTPLQNKSSA